MTTIVADAAMGYMAADRMVGSNDGDIAMSCETKIYEVEIGGDDYLVSLAGREGPGLIFLDWFENGDWDEPPEPLVSLEETDDFSAVVLGPDGIHISDKFMRLDKVWERWYAAGTGGLFAWAVLHAGCGIDKAMETAIRMDPNSGFGYQVKYLDGTIEEAAPHGER